MKRFYTITTALLMVAASFTSCTKDLDEVGLNATSIDAAKKGVQAANNSKVDADMYLNFSQSTPTVGSTISIAIGFNSNTPQGGKVHLEQWKLNSENVLAWVKIDDFALPSNQLPFTHSFTSNEAGPVQFRAHYIAQGTAGFNTTFLEGQVTYVNECTGANLSAQLLSANPVADGLTEYKVAFTLTSCEAYSNVKLQGGISATIEGSVEAISANGVIGDIRYNNKNAVVNWEGLNLTEGYSNTFYVTFRMENASKENPIGDWTAKVGDEVIASTTL